MSATEQGANLHQEALDDFILVRTDEVDEGERLRPVDPVWAAALGKVMLREGQRTPVEICRLPGRNRWTLVSGGHRLAGAKAEGIEHLRAEVVSADRDSRRLREVSENLWRRDLQPVDRAAFVAEAVAIHKRRAGIDPARDGRVASAQARWQQQVKDEAADATVTMTVAYGFTDRVAAELGLSSSSIERDLMLYKRLPASLVERLRRRRHPVLGNASQLRALAKLDALAQEQVVAALESTVRGDGKPLTVAQALETIGTGKPAADPEAKRLSAFIGAFSRMGLAEKKAALAELGALLPSPFRLTQGEPPRSALPADHVRYREETLAAIDTAREVIDGIVEDDILPGDRGSDLHRVSSELQLARFTIGGNGFALGAGK